MIKIPNILPLLLLGSYAIAQQERSPYDQAVETIQKEIDQLKSKPDDNLKWFGNAQADLKNKRVTIRACATGIKPTEPVEFFVVTGDSGKDYESISVATIKPSDLHHALESIGLKPGHPVDFANNHYWPRGDRVIMKFIKGEQSHRAEDLVLNLDTKKTLPQSGLLFTGSRRIEGKPYAADVVDARTLASIYNDPNTVLDLPDRTSQSGIYGFRKIIPDLNWKKGELLTITLEPSDEATDRDLLVYAHANGTFSINYTIIKDLPSLVVELSKLADGKTDLYTLTYLDDAMTIDQVRKFYAVLMSIEQDKAVKLDPPKKQGDLYHRAFFPDESWRKRENRLSEPWELFLSKADGNYVARLERQIENPDRQTSEKQIVERFDPQSPEDFLKLITEKQSHWTAAIFVYPPDSMTYGDLKKWVSPALPIYPKIFVFPDKK